MTGAGASKRARDEDRARITTLLDTAFAEGQLDGIEHRERVARVVQARMLSEIEAEIADLQLRFQPLPPLPAPPPRKRSALAPAVVGFTLVAVVLILLLALLALILFARVALTIF